MKQSDETFESRTRASFARQATMDTIGATLVRVASGAVDIALPHSAALTQQHGFLHAGILSTALDSACGYAAFTLMPADASVLTIEFKVNLLAPGRGEHFLFCGDVIKPGRTIMVAEGRAFAYSGTSRKLIATMTATLMTIVDREDVRG